MKYAGWDVQKTRVGLRLERSGIVLYRGDCLRVLPTLPAGGIDAVITDPIWPNAPEGMFPVTDPQRLLRRTLGCLPDGVRQVVIHLRHDSDPRFLQAVPAKYPYQQTTWLQYVFPSYLGRILGGNEIAYVFGRPIKFQPGRQVIPSVPPAAQSGGRGNKQHPCPRNDSHVKWLVNWFSDEWETVCDPFLGSGTTARACIANGRKFVGIEKNPEYFDEAVSLIDEALLLDRSTFFQAPARRQPELFTQ